MLRTICHLFFFFDVGVLLLFLSAGCFVLFIAFCVSRPKKTTLGARLASPDPLFLDFVAKMLVINPDERPSATQVCVACFLSPVVALADSHFAAAAAPFPDADPQR
jgi:hypothetical protein